MPSRSQVASHSAWSSGVPGAVLREGAVQAQRALLELGVVLRGLDRGLRLLHAGWRWGWRSPWPHRTARPTATVRRSRLPRRWPTGSGTRPSGSGWPRVGVGLPTGSARRTASAFGSTPSGFVIASTGRKASCAVRPTRSTRRSWDTEPGTDTMIAALSPEPWTVTSDSATPRPSTRWRMIPTAWSSCSSVIVPSVPGAVVGSRVTWVPPCRSRPSWGVFDSAGPERPRDEQRRAPRSMGPSTRHGR